jgi:hypothetical protein
MEKLKMSHFMPPLYPIVSKESPFEKFSKHSNPTATKIQFICYSSPIKISPSPQIRLRM